MAGIYIHIPFCRKACIYCDFHFSTQLEYKEKMVQAICMEIELQKNYAGNEIIESIYFGGGTPSVLTESELKNILERVRKNHLVADSAEITLEANPDDLSEERLKEFKQVGINRLSIGIQSFDEEELKWMNRSHTAQQSLDCVKAAQRWGFDNITIDLIYGSKFQDLDKWKQNLQRAFDLNVQHISAYNLTIENKTVLGTLFGKGVEPAVNDEFSEQCFEWLMEETARNGFIQYEISNFGTKDHFAIHNSNYWKGNKYIGIGPSAHSYDGKNRQWNIANNPQYIKSIEAGIVPFEKEELSVSDQYNEYLLTRLRTMWGVDINYLKEKFGVKYVNSFLESSKEYMENGEMKNEGSFYILTPKGKLLADRISSELFED